MYLEIYLLLKIKSLTITLMIISQDELFVLKLKMVKQLYFQLEKIKIWLIYLILILKDQLMLIVLNQFHLKEFMKRGVLKILAIVF